MKASARWAHVGALVPLSLAFWMVFWAEALPGEEAPVAATPLAESGEGEAPALATTIAAVTLYSNQALVVRRGTADLPEGRTRLEVRGLPAALRDEAVRARITGGAGARLANLEVRERHRTVFRKKEAEEAETALKEIQGRHRRAADAVAALDREAALLKSLEVGKLPEGRPEKPTPAPLEVPVWDATLKFVDRTLAENRRRARELWVELDGIEEEMAVAAAHAQKLASGKVHAEKAVVVELETAAPVRAELEIAYLVPGPGWWPRYDIRADVEAGKIELTSYALVRQESGEDWAEVELTFSAAEPARAADLPELYAWHIGEVTAEKQVAKASEESGEKLLRRVELHPEAKYAERLLLLSSPAAAAEPAQANPLLAVRETAERAQEALARKDKLAAKLPGGKAARTMELLRKVEEQRKANDLAARQKDWAAYTEGNRTLEEEIRNLDARYQTLFADDLLACGENIARGRRLLRSARLGDGLVAPVESSRGYDFKYRSLRRETIPSDGAFNKVVIGVEEFPAEFVYETAPALRELCFLSSRIRNQRRQPYLEGPASVFLGADFVGDGRVPTTARGEEFPVELGADEAVAVRRLEEKKRETTGLFTSYHQYRHEVEITVKNQKARAVRLWVLDRIPFTEEKGMEVERRSVSPPPTLEERKGLLRWDFPLEAGQEQKIAFSYSVELHAQRKVVGVADSSLSW